MSAGEEGKKVYPTRMCRGVLKLDRRNPQRVDFSFWKYSPSELVLMFDDG
jgi:hypothetical protein